MDGAIRQFQEYNSVITQLTAERNKKFFEAIQNSIISTKDKVCSVPKKTILKVNNMVKDLDLKTKNVVSKIKLSVVNRINKFLEFKNNVVNSFRRKTDCVKTTSKKQIEKIKEQFQRNIMFFIDPIDHMIEGIIVADIAKYLNSLEYPQVIQSKTDKVASVSSEKKEKLKKKFATFLDLDLIAREIGTKVQEGVVSTEIKVIDKYQIFKGNIIQFNNTAKNKVGTFGNKVKNKFNGMFKSDEATRQAKIDEINKRQQKIEELKKYRQELLSAKANEETRISGHSRGNIYSIVALVMGAVCWLSIGITYILINK